MTAWTGMYFGLTTLYPAMNLPYRYRYGPSFRSERKNRGGPGYILSQWTASFDLMQEAIRRKVRMISFPTASFDLMQEAIRRKVRMMSFPSFNRLHNS